MGMTIDKTISELEILKKNTFSYMTAHQAFITAIDVMRKYQKIQEIFKKYDKGELTHDMFGFLVGEIIEDGNNN